MIDIGNVWLVQEIEDLAFQLHAKSVPEFRVEYRKNLMDMRIVNLL